RSIAEPATLLAGQTVSGSALIDTSNLAARPYLAVVDVIDSTGNRLFRGISGFQVQGTAGSDTEPPIITITGLSDGQCGSAGVTPIISATDESAFTLVVTLDDVAFTSGTTVTAEGTHTLHAVATDVFGNQSQKTESFTIDRTSPAVSVSG